MTVSKAIVMLGCFDTKGEDFSFLYQQLKSHDVAVFTINLGVMDTSVDFPIDISAETVADNGGSNLALIRKDGDRGKAVDIMGNGAAKCLQTLVEIGKVQAVIGMGGGGGTYMALTAMQTVPFGIPKLCMSTLAGKDMARQLGHKDIVLMPSIVDVAGLNSISKTLIPQAAAAIVGMSKVNVSDTNKSKGTIAISMFGNTTPCVDQCTTLLKAKGYEVMAFHATGVGGNTMEALIRDGVFDGVIDVTTTELADNLCGGICDAGPNRLTAATEMGIPQVVSVGCLDMVNFAQLDTVPEPYKNRNLYSWAPDVTLLRTNAEENKKLGENIIDKLSKATSPVAILIPEKGISQVAVEGGKFYDPQVDQVLFDTIEKGAVQHQIPFESMNCHVNDEAFSRALVKTLLKQIKKQ